MIQRAIIIFCWVVVIGSGAFLRFDHLTKHPFHADEATGARITASRMTSGDYHFDPVHYHGPLLSSLAMPLCWWKGEDTWYEMSKQTLRLVPAVAGCLLLFVPLLWRRLFGDVPMLFASALMATSPLLVYYSRIYIHEMLLVLFGMMALFSIIRLPRWGIPGIWIGLMFATKESFAISMIAWSGAALLVALENRRQLDRAWWTSSWREYRVHLGLSLITAALTAGFFYTDGFRHLQGAIDAVRTYFVYQTVDGHNKPFGYYGEMFMLPLKSAGVWWYGTPVVLMALLGYASSFLHQSCAGSGDGSNSLSREAPGRMPGPRGAGIIRFLAYATLGHFLIYSLIRYKTPWLACLPWAHLCLLAGFAGLSMRRQWLKTAVFLLGGVCLITQFLQARQASGRFVVDARNPFAYVPTRSDMETLEPWLDQLKQVAPDRTLEPVGVIGIGYWPLPWYLRSFGEIGYWPTPPDHLTSLPVVFAMPEMADAVTRQLEHSHTAVPRGLRADVAVTLFIRNDIWNRWMENP